MASLAKQPNGRRTIQFVGSDGKRRSVRLGKVPQRTAQAVKLKIEHLVAAKISGHALDDETARWVRDLDSVLALADRLAAAGLIDAREEADEKELAAHRRVLLEANNRQGNDENGLATIEESSGGVLRCEAVAVIHHHW